MRQIEPMLGEFGPQLAGVQKMPGQFPQRRHGPRGWAPDHARRIMLDHHEDARRRAAQMRNCRPPIHVLQHEGNDRQFERSAPGGRFEIVDRRGARQSLLMTFQVRGIDVRAGHAIACQGLGRTRELQAAYLWSGLANIGLAIVLLLNNWWLFGLLTATFVRLVILREYCRRVFYASVPKIPGQHLKPNWRMLKRLWPNASKLGVLAIGSYLLSKGSMLICSRHPNPELTSGVVASFGLTATIGGFLTGFSTLWLVVKWPQLTMLRMQGRTEQMAALFARRLALTLATFVLMSALVVLTGDWLLALKGSHTRLLPTPFLIFYFAYLAHQLFYVQFGTLAYTENVIPFFKIGILTGAGMFALSYLLTRWLGLWGLLLAPLVAESVCSNWYTVRRGFRGQPLSVRQFFRAGLTGPI